MFNQAFFERLLIAVLGVVLVLAILPPFFRLIGFPATGDVMTIVKVVVAAIAIFYVFKPASLT